MSSGSGLCHLWHISESPWTSVPFSVEWRQFNIHDKLQQAAWRHGGVWHKETSQLRLLLPSMPFISRVPALFTPPDGFCLLAHAVHFLCFSQKKSYSCLSSISPSYHFFSFPPTDIFFLVSPLPLGWNIPTFSFFAESPWGCHPGALNILAHPPPYHRISASKSSQVMAAQTRVRGGHWILIINKVSQSCIIWLEGAEL